jgi:peptidoglycan/LPS O-acetylase OafA/YrhL
VQIPHEAAGRDATESQYYPWFDWLRIVLALVVAMAHIQIFTWPQAGNLSVQVFFALSGWLIGGILLGTDAPHLSRFYFNRATRIWIPYAAALVLLLGVGVVRDHMTPKYLEFIFYKVTFTYNLFGPAQLAAHVAEMPLKGTGNHFWSICAEEQFYLLAPLVLVVAPRRIGRSVVLWAGIALASLAFQFYAAITLGVLAAVLHAQVGPFQRSPVVKAVCGAVLVGATVMAGVGFAYETAAPLFAIGLVLLLAIPGTRSAIGSFLGGVSYPFYLNHWVGAFVSHALMRPLHRADSGLAKALAVAAGFVLSVPLYLAVDRRILRHRNAWYTPRLGWRLAISGFGLVFVGVVGGLFITRR